MKRLLQLLSPLGLLCAFASPVHATTPAGLETCQIPLVRNIEQAPVVDGVMRGSEWKYALTMTGLITNEGALSQRQAKISYITDGEYLYVGMVVPAVPEGTAPEVKQGVNYEEPSYDKLFKNDHVEAQFGPPNHNENGDFYLVADSVGHLFSQRIKGEFKPFTGPWEIKSSSDDKGWTMEMRMKLSEFGVPAAKDGDTWTINYNAVLQFPLAFLGLVSGAHQVAPAIIAADAAAVQFESLGDLPLGKLNLAVTVREYEGVVATPKEGAYDERVIESGGLSLPSTGKVARMTATLLDGDGKSVFTETKLAPLLPAKRIPIAITHDFTPSAKNTLTLKIETASSSADFKPGSDPSKIAVMYASSLPFVPYNKKEAGLWQERFKKGTVLGSWRITPAFFPYWGKTKVEATFFKGKIADAARRLRVSIDSDKGFHAEKEVAVENGALVVPGPEKLVEIAIPGLPEGTYTTAASVLDAEGKVLSTLKNEYVRKVFPWEHNSLGKSRGVIKPWTPMSVSVQGCEVRCWGRAYTVGPLGMPSQIVSNGKPLLAAPVSIELRGESGALPCEMSAITPWFDEIAKDRVRWHSEGGLGDSLKASIRGLAEYDGFTWYEVALTAASPVKVTTGRIVIALPEDVAQLMHFQSCWARNNFSGAVPRGEGSVFRSLDTVNYGRKGGFSPHVWIGNLTRGLSWFADSDEGWCSAPDKSALEIIRKDGQVQLVMNIINRPVTLDKPRTIRFGLMATPFKPLLPIRKLEDRYVNWLSLKDKKTVIQPFMYAPYPKDYSMVDEHIPGRRLYFNKHEMGAALPERAVFDNEWGGIHPDPDYPGAPERFGPGIVSRTISRALTESKIDMQVYYISELAKKTKMPGTYWDITGISVGLPMVENGTGYVDAETGHIVPTFDILKSRELFKRVATMWQEVRGEPDYMEIHATNHMGIPFYSFAYEWLNFEWLAPALKAKRQDGKLQDFIDLRPLDLFATEGVPAQMGVWINAISHGVRPDDPAEYRRIQRSASALGGLHNHLRGYQPTLTPRDGLAFVGYWDEAVRITSDLAKVKASLWQKGNQLEVILVNLDDQAATAKIQLDGAKLGIKGIQQIEDITPESELEDYIKSLKRQKKTEAASKAEEVLAEVKASKPAVTTGTDGAFFQIVVPGLPSHDYRVVRVKAE